MNDKRTYDLDELRDAWQAFSAKLDKACEGLPPVELHFVDTSAMRRQTATAVAVAALCLLALVWLLCLPADYVADRLDLVPHAVAGLMLLYAFAYSLLTALHAVKPSASRQLAARFVAAIAVAAIVIITLTPAYNGRTLSAGADRMAALQTTYSILANVA